MERRCAPPQAGRDVAPRWRPCLPALNPLGPGPAHMPDPKWVATHLHVFPPPDLNRL